jgi:hypothetical protein
MTRLLRPPSPALVVASLALLVALGGTGYAAVVLPKNSVGAAQIRAGAVTSADVKDAALQAVDLAPTARQTLRGQTGRQGPVGPAGPKGDTGPPGLTGLEIVTASSQFDSGPQKSVVVVCPPGKRVVGGGAGAWGRAMIWVTDGIALTASHALDERTWHAIAREISPTEESWFLRVNAVCATA